MTDREMLQQLATFLNKRTFIQGDEASIRDMVKRYANPPLTLVNRVSMRLTVNELNQLNSLMQKVNGHLQSTLHNEEKAVDVH
jgi:hypothetical protein